MIDIKKDNKSPTWIITKTDSEGFHHQVNLTKEEMRDLMSLLVHIPVREL